MKKRSYRRPVSISVLLAAILLGITCVAPAAKDTPDKTTDQAVAKKQKKARHFKGRLPNYYGKVVTEEQRQKIYDIQKEYKPQIKKLREQLKKLTAEQNEKIDALLTPEQREKIDSLKQAAKDKRKKTKKTKADAIE